MVLPSMRDASCHAGLRTANLSMGTLPIIGINTEKSLMSGSDSVTIELALSHDMEHALRLAAQQNGRQLADEILSRLHMSLKLSMRPAGITEADMLSVAGKIALMAGNRRHTKRIERKRRNGNEVS
jgi:hypothetical protein